MCWTLRGPTPRRDAGRARRWARLTLAVATVAALACGCADAGPTAPAGAAQSIHIDTYTPQGLRAKQVMERLSIAESRRVRGLGIKQVAALEREFGPQEPS